MNLSHNEKNEHLANMPDARLQNKGNHHATFRTRSSKPVRLPLKSQRSPCGDFAEDSFRVKRKFKESSATRYYVEEGLPLLVMSRGKYKQFKQLWLEGKPSST